VTARAARRTATLDAAGIRALAAAREPVVIEGFLEGSGLARARTPAAARELLGDVALELREEFVSWSLRHGGAADRRPARASTVAAYLDLLEADPATPWMCTEFPTPEALLARMGGAARALCDADRPVSFAFVGGRGHHAHLHYDGDFRNVLLVQVFGRKRAVMASPDASDRLLAIGNFSGVFLDRLAGARREAFEVLVDAWTADIGPGDALFMPAALWHYLEYPETGMSINLRFGATPWNARLAGRFHAHGALQRIAWHLADGHAPGACEEEGLRALLALAGPCEGDPRARGAEIEALTARLAAEWCGIAPAAPFAGNADALREAATRHECARLYPAAPRSLAGALSGWEPIARG
jgi:lysine-specific demethylase 8